MRWRGSLYEATATLDGAALQHVKKRGEGGRGKTDT
jgi:hypothetical protein